MEPNLYESPQFESPRSPQRTWRANKPAAIIGLYLGAFIGLVIAPAHPSAPIWIAIPAVIGLIAGGLVRFR